MAAAGSASKDGSGNRQRQVRREEREPTLFVAHQLDGSEVSRQPNSQFIPQPEDHVVPTIGQLQQRQIGKIRSLLLQ